MMVPSKVKVLPSWVAERIAAGEVIERPASIVKELVENSLDAGATEISVQLRAGGKSLIEVLDNGSGMDSSDLALCVKRHATSKLESLDDLEKIHTLGFRGEALPSVAAVSELIILSKQATSETAYQLSFLPTGESKVEPATFGHFLGSSHGTKVTSEGLFSQIPARLKFLKSQAAEVGQVREWIERLALTHPGTGFKLFSEDRQVLNLRPQDEIGRIRQILTDGEDYPILTATSEDTHVIGLKLRAHWIQGLSSPQSKKIVQIVNKRAVRDRLIQQALFTSFKQLHLPGQYPALALFVEINPALLDVNVHPTKTEVRFLESGKVFRAVNSLVDSLISKNGAPSFVAARGPDSASPSQDAQMPSGSNNLGAAFQFSRPEQYSSSLNRSSSGPDIGPDRGYIQSSGQKAWQPTLSPTLMTARESSESRMVPETAAAPSDVRGSDLFHLGRFAGVLFNTYIIYEMSQEFCLIDQHAAHERIRYEKLKNRVLSSDQIHSQPLLVPEVVHFDPELRATLEERLPLLSRLGFEVEIFGEDAIVFRALAADWGTNELRTRLKNLVDRVAQSEFDELEKSEDSKFQTTGELNWDEQLFEKLASEACHSAVRAGDRLEPEAVQTIVKQLFECEHPWNCPHGRPTVVKVPKQRLEEWFQRKVPHGRSTFSDFTV